jgi:hypothetical protein
MSGYTRQNKASQAKGRALKIGNSSGEISSFIQQEKIQCAIREVNVCKEKEHCTSHLWGSLTFCLGGCLCSAHPTGTTASVAPCWALRKSGEQVDDEDVEALKGVEHHHKQCGSIS